MLRGLRGATAGRPGQGPRRRPGRRIPDDDRHLTDLRRELAIISNRLADGARRYARQTAREVHVDDPAVTFADRPTNTNHESFEDREVLEQAIRSLPRGQREAIELLKLKELSLKEAAAASGLSIGALKVATHRAMVALRRTLNGTESHED